ncbi:LOW QUALITY PROTEIN: putative oxidoreductase [Geomicrobium sp. JCM 19037]|nr:LOW QUALITY PROTEIN: putative oxidoreductase [Geomicrobium sp. JCM 19037]
MKRYVVCGVSNRAISMFIAPMIYRFAVHCQLVGLLDIDAKRFDVCAERIPETKAIPTYENHQFEFMVQEEKPDVVIVSGRDDTHVEYILEALSLNLDVIVEKPLATTAEDSERIVKAEQQSKGKVIVTFNYRYSPYHLKIKELLLEGKIGKITSVDLNWYIDTFHGSSYFQRWNRLRERSGGLSIHKSSHHFDLVSWWLDQRPLQVFAYGDRFYYGDNSEYNPAKEDGRFCGTCQVRQRCTYYTRWNSRSNSQEVQDDHISMNKRSRDGYSNYRPDQCIYDSEINIEDAYTATVKYDRGAILSYSINFSLPYEAIDWQLMGQRAELKRMEYHAPSRVPFPTPRQTIDYFPLFGAKETIHVVEREGGHGGGDPVIQEDLFLGEDPHRPYDVLSGSEDGAYAVATGEAVWKSATLNQPINVDDILTINLRDVHQK